jgi:hypothetical protein
MRGSLFDMAFTGVLVGVVLVTTIILIPRMRAIVLVAATSVIAIGYLHGGVAELVAHADALRAEVIRAPTFSAGLIAGAVVAVALMMSLRPRPKK